MLPFRSPTTIAITTISFSGFLEYAGCKGSKNEQQEVIDLIRANFPDVSLHLDATFTSAITHLVAPANSVTTKILVASLTRCWVLTPQWILDSAKAKTLLPEARYGTRNTGQPFKAKSVFLSKQFLAESARSFTATFYRQLIEQIGKGLVVDDVQEADIVCTSKADGVALPIAPSALRLTSFKEFIRFVLDSDSTGDTA